MPLLTILNKDDELTKEFENNVKSEQWVYRKQKTLNRPKLVGKEDLTGDDCWKKQGPERGV